jgi:hypothetical protein
MNKLPKEKRERFLLVLMGTVGILAALYLLVVSAQRTSLQECADKTDVAREKLEKAQRWLRMNESIHSRLAACRAELETKQADMAPVDKFKWFYNTLDTFLAQHRVKLVDISREPGIGELGVLPKFPYQAASFGVKLTARYHDFGAFLADFENRFPYMRVQNLRLESMSAAPAEEALSASERQSQSAETLAITMRVVTLVKPLAAL